MNTEVLNKFNRVKELLVFSEKSISNFEYKKAQKQCSVVISALIALITILEKLQDRR